MSDSTSKAPNSTSSRRSTRTASVPAAPAPAPPSNSGKEPTTTTEDILEVESSIPKTPTAAAAPMAAMTTAAGANGTDVVDGMQVDEPEPAQQQQQAGDVVDVDAQPERSDSVSGSVNGKGEGDTTSVNGKGKGKGNGNANANGDSNGGDADDADEDGGSDHDSEIGEGEYEIEAILEHKKLTGRGKAGQHEYLVSWVGYGPEFNEWVSEDNFGSHEMIDAYWAKMGGKPQKTQSKRVETSSGSKRRRAEDSPSASAGPSTKRGRRTFPPVTDLASDAEAEEASVYAKSHKDSMKEYADHKSWEDDVKSIETIERGANEKLIVYMIMKNGEKTAQDVETCNARCPQKMLKFYEGHLKWRQTK